MIVIQLTEKQAAEFAEADRRHKEARAAGQEAFLNRERVLDEIIIASPCAEDVEDDEPVSISKDGQFIIVGEHNYVEDEDEDDDEDFEVPITDCSKTLH